MGGLSCLLLVLALLPPAAPGRAAPPVERRQQLREVEKQLELKRREISEFVQERDGLKRELSALATSASESRSRLRAMEEKIGGAVREKREIVGRLAAIHLAEDRWRRVMAEELNGYLRQQAADSDYFGRKELWEQALRRAALREKLRYVEGLHGVRFRAETARSEAERRKARLEASSAAARAEHKSRESLYQRKREALDETQQRLARVRKEVDELRESAAELGRLLRSLEAPGPYRPKARSPDPGDPKHSWPWPADGRIVRPFGKQAVPELKTWVIHPGLRLATAAGAQVRPIKQGKVIYAGPFRSYGNVVIVDHGRELYSIYGMLGEMFRRRGDSVRPAQPLGTAGSSPDGGGALYFEVRHAGEALDPLPWLKPRS